MNALNPYNCTKPGHLFVGYERLRQDFLDGFCNGNSFAVLGGRRCGKTSLLMQIEKDLKEKGVPPFHVLPVYFSTQEFGNLTPEAFFEMIYCRVVREINGESWKPSEAGREYQHFLGHLDLVAPRLSRAYGPDWLVVLLIDELDNAVSSLPDDQLFQNLRHFLMESRFHRHFRLVATGVKDLARLISSGSSLNNLRHKYLAILKSKSAKELVHIGFPDESDTETLFRVTGKHPFLLQGVLEKLWDEGGEWDRDSVRRASGDFLKEHKVFARWMTTFGPADHAVYRCLAESPQGSLPRCQIQKRIDASLAPEAPDALTVLSYHGVVDDSDEGEPEIAGTLFSDWYLARAPMVQPSRETQERSAKQRVTARPTVFISYSHEDESEKDSLLTHLGVLGSAGLIEVWSDDRIGAGGDWQGEIKQAILSSRVAILLVTANFLTSKFILEKEVPDLLMRREMEGITVFPVIAKPCAWKAVPWLTKMNVRPKNGIPVWREGGLHADEHLAAIAEEAAEILTFAGSTG